MFASEDYIRVLTSICAVLATLLGSVGIFVSLTVQRRVERLQDILEEFLDLSYHSDTNITGKMYKLIEKYQMHYLFPNTPGRAILQYINFTIVVLVISWVVTLAISFRWRWEPASWLYMTPVFLGLGILLFYRYLLKNVIYPFGNNLMSPLIPPPVMLRSVSFLSSYVNVSVKSLLRQARLRLLIKIENNRAKVILKQELSFDGFFYYMLLSAQESPVFAAYGELKIDFGNEVITGKPIPAARNLSIPLGYIPVGGLSSHEYEARFFIFPQGEKHPLEYLFNLQKQGDIITMSGEPEISVNYMVTYRIERNSFQIIEENAEIPFFRELAGLSSIAQERAFCCGPFSPQYVEMCTEKIYID